MSKIKVSFLECEPLDRPDIGKGKVRRRSVEYKVTDKGGYNHDIGKYWKRVQTPDGEKMVVGRPGFWRFWTPEDRTQHLRNRPL